MACPRCGGTDPVRAVRLRGSAVLALWAGGLALAWLLGGRVLHDLVEGLDRSRLPLGLLVPPVVVLGAAVVATALRLRRPVCPACRSGVLVDAGPADIPGATRRTLLRASGAAVAAGAGGVAAAVGRNAGWLPSGQTSSARRLALRSGPDSSTSSRTSWS